MCGIVAVLRRPTDRLPPELAGLADLIAAASGAVQHGIADARDASSGSRGGRRSPGNGRRRAPGLGRRPCAARRPVGRRAPRRRRSTRSDRTVRDFVDRLDAEVGAAPVVDEPLNRALALVRDRLWGLRCDRLRTADAVGALAGDLRTIGRDRRLPLGPGRAVGDRPARGARPGLRRPRGRRAGARARSRTSSRRALAARAPTRCSAPARCAPSDGAMCFVYKAAAEIGELGDNVAALPRHDRTTTTSCTPPSTTTPPACSCSATRAGRASASSPKRTRTR